MKRISVYLALILSVFIFSAGTVNSINEKVETLKCPYLQKLQQTPDNSICPFLNDKQNYGQETTPEMKKDEPGCPYIDSERNEDIKCPYLEGLQHKKGLKKTKYYRELEIKSS